MTNSSKPTLACTNHAFSSAKWHEFMISNGGIAMNNPGHAIIIGGSMGGLFAARLLLSKGWTVDVYERISLELAGRGAGIVTHPELFEILNACGIDSENARVGVEVEGRRVFGQDGSVVAERPHPQVLTS